MMSTYDLLPSPPQTQALSSNSFHLPPLDGTLSLPELYDWQAKNSPEHPLFIFSRSNGGIRTIFWSEAVRAIHTGARHIRNSLGWKPGMKEVPVVAILVASDTITYYTTVMAIMRAGYTPFPISPRNSAAAIAHLINQTQTKFLIIGHEQSLKDLGGEAVKIVDKQNSAYIKPAVISMPLFEDLFSESLDEPEELSYERRGPEEVAVYFHSSGSTAFPKPIPWTHHQYLQFALIPYFGERDLTGAIISLHAIPMFHSMGGAHLCWTVSTGLVISAFEPKSPAIIPTPQSLFEAALTTKSNLIISVPAIIEEWSRKPDYVNWLATRWGLLYGGGPLNKGIGDFLTSRGVPLFVLYGFTEGGVVCPVVPAQATHDWEYFRIPGNITPELVPYGDGIYRLIMVKNAFSRPSIVNMNVNGEDAYDTSDLLMRHPEKEGYWKVYGRADDQIMHSTGEKTNPGPLETTLNQDPHVRSSVMFGRGQFQAGVIIDPKPEFQFDPSDEVRLADFRNKIWPSVQKLNTFAPQHSRLFKEMIIVCDPGKPFQYTAKNTARRQAVIRDYQKEIDALYEAVAESTQSVIRPPTHWDGKTTEVFVRATIEKVLGHNVEEDANIFQRGCDSLQATWIRNTILRALRDSAKIDTRSFVDNFVYDYPTVSSMVRFLNTLVTSGGATEQSWNAKVAAMRNMVDKYTSSKFSRRIVSSTDAEPTPNGDCVLVTGSTGALGSHLLASLVCDPGVRLIYAINRSHGPDMLLLAERQRQALIEKGLDADFILGSVKVRLIEADISLLGFGIPVDAYEEIKRDVTHIIQNAWPVDFNQNLSFFEQSVKGLRNLIDFSLASPHFSAPSIVYISSVGVFNNIKALKDDSLLESSIPPEVACGNGYSESKWVSEEMLARASTEAGVKSLIVRVGQLCGSSNGFWSTTEWVPAMVQSAQSLGCLPMDNRSISWIPLDIAARTLVDARSYPTGSSSLISIAHLIHPNPVSWLSIAKIIATEVSAELVPFSEWLEKLENAVEASQRRNDDASLQNLRASRLMPFFQSLAKQISEGYEAFGFHRLQCSTAIRLSKEMPKKAIGGEEVLAWLKYWSGVGFLTPVACVSPPRHSAA